METKIKVVGTREEVYKCLASRTAGGLQKNDIIEKQTGNKTIYISKKLSEKMKENINILRIQNLNLLKKKHKKTIVNIPQEILVKDNHQKHNENKTTKCAKTHKLSFKVSDNEFKNIYYPELKGINLKELKQELKNEEDTEDLGLKLTNTNNTKLNNIFKIEELPDININELS